MFIVRIFSYYLIENGARGKRSKMYVNYNAVLFLFDKELFLSSPESVSLLQGKPWSNRITSCVLVLYVFFFDCNRDIAVLK